MPGQSNSFNLPPKPSPKTLYLLDDPGKDKHVHKYVLEGLLKEGFLPTIGYFYGRSEDSVMAHDNLGAFSLGLKRKQFRGIRLDAALRLGQIIEKKGFDLVHCQRHRPLVHAGLALVTNESTPLFYTVRSTNVLRNWKRRFAFRLLASRITRVICVSHAVKDYIARTAPYLSSKKLVVIHNGVDLSSFENPVAREEARRFLSIPVDGFYFGIVARLKKAKGHDGLLKAFAYVVKRFPDTRLAIVGDGPLLSSLESLVGELGIGDKVFFTGRVQYHQVPMAMQAFDCFVHPSYREGLGVAILEAMASRLPVITTAADGIRDIFETWQRKSSPSDLIGKMVLPRDVDALARAMYQFRAMDKEELRRIGDNARRHVEEDFSSDKMVRATVDLYKEAIFGGRVS